MPDTVPTGAAERIAHVVSLLLDFGGGDLTRHQAETLLGFWRNRSTLTPRDRDEVLKSFPPSHIGVGGVW